MKRHSLAGRPAWYEVETGSIKRPLVIGIAGGSASGKTSVSKAILEKAGVQWIALIHMDSFYRGLTEQEKKNPGDYNFDHPDAFDMDLLVRTIEELRAGRSVGLPTYDFKTHSRVAGENKYIYGADVILVEGIYVLFEERIRNLLDIKLFVDTEDDIRLARRLRRDILERGRNVESVLAQYERFVKPSFDDHVSPTKRFADVIIPRGCDNYVAINILALHVKAKLLERGWAQNERLKPGIPQNAKFPPSVHFLDQDNVQLKVMSTILRNKDTPRQDFIFTADRVSRLLIESAMEFLPFTENPVVTPTEATYQGLKFPEKLCSISIMRSGDSMTKAVLSVIRNIKLGSVLIQTSEGSIDGPRLFFCQFPPDLKGHKILLLDPTLGSGNTCLMAIRILLDHGIPEEDIIFVTILCSTPGLHTVTQRHPKLRVVCAFVDEGLKDGIIIPGLGNFGNRYFGTEDDDTQKD